jgi:hypothetical protein
MGAPAAPTPLPLAVCVARAVGFLLVGESGENVQDGLVIAGVSPGPASLMAPPDDNRIGNDGTCRPRKPERELVSLDRGPRGPLRGFA